MISIISYKRLISNRCHHGLKIDLLQLISQRFLMFSNKMFIYILKDVKLVLIL